MPEGNQISDMIEVLKLLSLAVRQATIGVPPPQLINPLLVAAGNRKRKNMLGPLVGKFTRLLDDLAKVGCFSEGVRTGA